MSTPIIETPIETGAELSVIRLDEKKSQSNLAPIIGMLLIAGLGFMIDVYDIVLFAVLRVPSLLSLGVPEAQSMSVGVFLLNMQMAGMILGGFLWGVLGDKKGRKSALFGSILLYSVATLLNGFVTDVTLYAVLRFLAGIGLAGEVGAAMTIAAEVTPRQYRAYGTAAVAGLGVFGAILASFVGDLLPWRTGFIVAGAIGILLLLARLSMKESALFVKIVDKHEVSRGSLRALLLNKSRFGRLIRCVLAAVPLWYVFGVLVSFAPEICATQSALAIAITVGAVALSYSIGETTGEVVSGIASQLLGSRRKAMGMFLLGAIACTTALFLAPKQYYGLICIPLGFFVGSWSVIVTTAAELFGTNLRATATTLVPNMVRASAIPITLGFSCLAATLGPVAGAAITGAIVFLAAGWSILTMEETFGRDLDFVE